MESLWKTEEFTLVIGKGILNMVMALLRVTVPYYLEYGNGANQREERCIKPLRVKYLSLRPEKSY